MTADHGQVEVGRALRILDPELMADTVMVSGEGRFRWLHAAPESGRASVADGPDQRYDDEAWVWTTDELEDGGFFGGRLTATARSRVGDVAIVPRAPVAYLDPSDQGDAMLICRHGSLTEAEMLVPLLAVAADDLRGWLHVEHRTFSTRRDPRPGRDGAAERRQEESTETVEQPAKVMRIGSMIKQLLDEVRQAPLDECQSGAAAGDLRPLDQRAGRRAVAGSARGAAPA